MLPPLTLDVNENSNLKLSLEMDGNPKPSADFKWPHLSGSSQTNVSSVQLYPFIYSSTYSLNNIDASYCGRILQTTVKNSVGSSRAKDTYVTVLCESNDFWSLFGVLEQNLNFVIFGGLKHLIHVNTGLGRFQNRMYSSQGGGGGVTSVI